MRIQLPKDILRRVSLGSSFAENDIVRRDPQVFVTTSASIAADLPESGKCFFIGRRGTGKTAITYHLQRNNRRTLQIVPQVFDLVRLPLDCSQFGDTRQRPFKSLVASFERALLGELLRVWARAGLFRFDNAADAVSRERGLIETCDFDQRVLAVVAEIFDAYESSRDRLWLRQLNRSQELLSEITQMRRDGNYDYVFLLDRIDESWDGSESAVICLRALMHACIRINAACPSLRTCLFLRENIFDRVRANDNEFGRLETSVVHLEWTQEKLVEMVERRLSRQLTTKPALGGETWRAFVADDESWSVRNSVLALCQNRPRDVLTFMSYAVEAAVGANHIQITQEDVSNAKKRFSLSRLKELSDEFSENYPNIGLVLGYFYGLGTEYTLPAIEQFIQRLLVDPSVQKYCGKWFSENSAPHLFIGILFNIGFIGVREGSRLLFRGAGDERTLTLRIEHGTTFAVHPSYVDALGLRNVVLTELTEQTALKTEGVLQDLPTGVSFESFQKDLQRLVASLDQLPKGAGTAAQFEELVAEIVRLCFFRSLANVEIKVRNRSGSVIRDVVASNRASNGFWEMIRSRHGATQIIFECKNYADLAADDWHQLDYYISKVNGNFLAVVFRGQELPGSAWQHIRTISERHSGAVVLPITEKDLRVFLRQAINGKIREDHLNEMYDRVVRSIS